MSESADPLDAVFGDSVDSADDLRHEPDAAMCLERALVELDVDPVVAAELGWDWCPDSRGLRGRDWHTPARPLAGIVGPLRFPVDPDDLFFLPVPATVTGEVFTSEPTNVLARLPAGDAGRTLHVADGPVAAARLFGDGHRVAWIRGHDGWRGKNRQPIPSLQKDARKRPVVLHPSERCWRDAVVFDSGKALAEALVEIQAGAGVQHGVKVETPYGRLSVKKAFAAGRRPATERQRQQQRSHEDLRGARAPRDADWEQALDRADELFVSRNVSFFLGGLRADEITRAVIACLSDVAQGPGGPWAYDHGVWRPAWSREQGRGGAVGMLVARLLGNSYRPSHEDVVLKKFERLPDLPVLHAHPELDGWAGLINFSNGLFDWRTGGLQPHDPSVLSTWQLPVPFEPDAQCPLFRRFLAQVLPADMLEEIDGVAAWQEDLGYLLLPGNPLHVAFLLRGGGRNGKGVWMDVAKALVGHAAVTTLTLEDMVSDRSRFRLARLVGSALNLCSELDPKYIASTATFKALTGGDTLTLEEKNKQPFDYKPYTTMVFSANDDFPAADRSVAYFDRFQVRAFPNYIPQEYRDPQLAARIIADELPGVAAAAVAGLRALMNRSHFRTTASSQAQKRQFREHSDHLLRFIDERVHFEPAARVKRSDIYPSYKLWCDDEGIQRPLTAHVVLEAVRRHARERGVVTIESKSSGAFFITGLDLDTPDHRTEDSWND